VVRDGGEWHDDSDWHEKPSQDEAARAFALG
jgi:hypothetical protein